MPASTNTSKRTTPRKPGNAHITSAAAWQKQDAIDGVVTELPSGKTVMLIRKLDLPVMLKSGRIPNPLASIISGMIGKETTEFPDEQMKDPVVFEQMLNMVDSCVCSSMVEPKCIASPVKGKRPGNGFAFPESDEEFEKRWNAYEERLADVEANTISADWISLEDKVFIFFFSQGGAADLATFRSATSNSMASISGSQAVELPAE